MPRVLSQQLAWCSSYHPGLPDVAGVVAGALELGLLRRPHMLSPSLPDRADSLDSAASSIVESAPLAGQANRGL